MEADMGADFETELGALIEKWRHVDGTDAILEGLDLYVLSLEESREATELAAMPR